MVRFDEGRQVCAFGKALLHANAFPAFQRGGPYKAHGLHIERAGHGKADAEHALAGFGVLEFLHERKDFAERRFGRGVGKLALFAGHHFARQIDESSLKPQRRDVDANGIAAFGIDAEAGGGIAAAFGSIPDAGDIILLFQFADNVGKRFEPWSPTRPAMSARAIGPCWRMASSTIRRLYGLPNSWFVPRSAIFCSLFCFFQESTG